MEYLDSDYFAASLSAFEPETQGSGFKMWTSVTQYDLFPDDYDFLSAFLDNLSPGLTLPEELGLIKSDAKTGQPERIYLAAVFGDSALQSTVLKIAGVVIPVEQDGKEFKVGNHPAELHFKELENRSTKEKFSVPYLSIDIEGEEWAIPLRTLQDTNKATIKAQVAQKKPLWQLLREMPTGNGGGGGKSNTSDNLVSMEDLPLGRYEVSRIGEFEYKKEGAGKGFILSFKNPTVTGVTGTFAKGSSKLVLSRQVTSYQDALEKGTPVVLVIRGKDQLPSGSWSVAHGLTLQRNGGNTLNANTAMKQLTGVFSGEAVDVNFDEVPF